MGIHIMESCSYRIHQKIVVYEELEPRSILKLVVAKFKFSEKYLLKLIPLVYGKDGADCSIIYLEFHSAVRSSTKIEHRRSLKSGDIAMRFTTPVKPFKPCCKFCG
jgi:hypothetical protein